MQDFRHPTDYKMDSFREKEKQKMLVAQKQQQLKTTAIRT